MKDYTDLSKFIIENIGGKENVNNVVHCITRLRFNLKDESKANTKALSNHDGIVKVLQSGGQYQIVIGNEVSDVYKEIVKQGGFGDNVSEDNNNSNGFVARAIDIISSVLSPLLGILAATGLIKGLLTILVFAKLLDAESGTYHILFSIANSVFYFLPVYLGYLSFKKFGGNPFIGLTIGAIFCYPDIVNWGKDVEVIQTLFEGTFFQSSIKGTFLTIPVIMMNYTSSIIPVIVTSYFGAKLEKFLQKIIPNVLKMFMIPMLTLLFIVPLAFLIIGPITTWLAQLVGLGVNIVYNLSLVVAGIIIGAFWQVLVIFGLH